MRCCWRTGGCGRKKEEETEIELGKFPTKNILISAYYSHSTQLINIIIIILSFFFYDIFILFLSYSLLLLSCRLVLSSRCIIMKYTEYRRMRPGRTRGGAGDTEGSPRVRVRVLISIHFEEKTGTRMKRERKWFDMRRRWRRRNHPILHVQCRDGRGKGKGI